MDARHDDITVLRATEVDILADGRLDFDDALLAGFDWVTASMHSGLTQDADAHHGPRCWPPSRAPSSTRSATPPAGCWVGASAAPVDIDRLAEPPRRRPGTFLEVNGQPRRLDLDSAMARRALAAGARLTIGADAHSGEALDCVRFGVLVARRAGARPEDVGNTRDWPELAAARARRLAAAGVSPADYA